MTTPHLKANSKVEYWHLLGRQCQANGDCQGAKKAYHQALALDPHYLRSLNNLAVLALQDSMVEEAESILQRGLDLGVGDVDQSEIALLLNTLCQLRLQQQRPKDAVAVAKLLVKLSPQDSYFTNLAVALQLNRQLEAAQRAQRHALRLDSSDPLQLLWQPIDDPQASAQRHRELQNLATMDLAHNPFSQEGWSLLQARLAAQPAHWVTQSSPWHGLWSGERVPELLLWDEQGFGDAIQCFRWLKSAVARAGRVRLWLRPQLLRLVERRLCFPSHVAVMAWPAGAEPWREQVPHLPLMSLPLALRLSGPELAENLLLKRVSVDPRPRSVPHVGLVWAAGRKTDPEADRQARKRSLPLAAVMALLEPAVRDARLQLSSLQVGPDAQECEPFSPLLTPTSPFNDWEETARVVERLDGVISVDTAVAHLAGSLGVPTFLLLTEPCDWRWGLKGDFTPWYSSVRLIRGADQSAVLRGLQDVLARWF